MQNQNLKIQLQRLNNLFNKVNGACGNDIEMQSHWAKYLCILCSGFLENAVTEIYGDFVKNASGLQVSNFTTYILSRIQNPKAAKFIEISTKFKKDWGESLEVFLNDNGRKEAINTIMTHRHLIAHGKTSNITLVQIKEYLKLSVEVLEFIENQLCNVP